MFFLTFEGLDGCGKGVQIDFLKNRLAMEKIKVLQTGEPGGSFLGIELKELLKDPKLKINSMAEYYLFCAARSELVEKTLKKYKNKDVLLICDRYVDSSIAYQAYGRGLPLEFVEYTNAYTISNCMPDLTIWIDASPAECFDRLKRRGTLDRIEKAGLEFFERVRQGYLRLWKENSDRVKRVNGNMDYGAIHEDITKIVLEELKKRRELGNGLYSLH